MALQNVRSLLWRGEDLGSMGGGTRELIVTTQVAAAARPQISSLAFVGTLNIAAFLGTAQNTAVQGLNRIIFNKSPDYWMTLLASVAAGGTAQPIQVPIPPLGSYFIPANVFSSASVQVGMLVMNSTWPIPLPISGVGSAVIPLATLQTALTADIMLEQ